MELTWAKWLIPKMGQFHPREGFSSPRFEDKTDEIGLVWLSKTWGEGSPLRIEVNRGMGVESKGCGQMVSPLEACPVGSDSLVCQF
jgi:hypothetical protein